MSIIVAVVATKGGACKTTTAVGLATSLDESIVGPVGLIDTDPQATASSWLRMRSKSLRPTRADEVRQAAAGEGVTIIDTQPAATPSAVAVMEAADLIVAPTRLGPGDLKALNQLCRMVEPDLVVPVAMKTRSTSHAQGLELLKERFGDRVTVPVPDSVVVETAQETERAIPRWHLVGQAYAEIADSLTHLLKGVNAGG